MSKVLYVSLIYVFVGQLMVAEMDFPKIPANSFGQRLDVGGEWQKPTHIILHYTAMCSMQDVINFFQRSNTQVSAHYVVGPNGETTEMVDPKDKAFHAGVSFWKGVDGLNNYSIGIEIAHPGYSDKGNESYAEKCPEWKEKDRVDILGSDKNWYHFRPEQIESVIKLCKFLMDKHQVPPQNVIGHGDIAPGRKVDPGPLFPWNVLCQQGIGICPEDKKAVKQEEINQEKAQQMLRNIGYKVTPENFQSVLIAFQMHFRPCLIDGKLDEETYSLLSNIDKKE